MFISFFWVFLLHGLAVNALSSNLLGNIPLAVKTPYLHAWIPNRGEKAAPEHIWPNYFTNNREFDWSGLIRVDGKTYQWMGKSVPLKGSMTLDIEITPTRSIFTIQAGPVQFNATFLSPIEPNDYTRQSIPFSYMFLDGFLAKDSQSHTVQVYTDIDAQWVTGDDKAEVKWETRNSSDMVYHSVTRQNREPMKDSEDMAEDGEAYYATLQRSGLTWQTSQDLVCQANFKDNGKLDGSKDNDFRAVSDRWIVLCYSVDLGIVAPGDQLDPIVWALGLVRNPLLEYATDSGIQNRTGYYWSAYSSIDGVMSDFLKDFTNAKARSVVLDNKVLNAALSVSPEYAGILALVTRQVFASMDITLPVAPSGARPTASDVKIFMKDVSVSTRANPVEVIYGALPALLYFNSSFAHDLFLPLLEFQTSSGNQNPYAAPDLGNSYPMVHGNSNTDTKQFATESCGSMLIMMYAYAVKTGNGSLITQYHSTLQRWADFLVQNSLHPEGAVSADGLYYPGMSNLALKGILGVYSMAKINQVVDPSNTTFMDQANELIKNWKQSVVKDTHIQAQYDNADSWGLMYNLFPAIWLETGLIEDDILSRQAEFYLSHSPPTEDESYSLDSNQNGIAYPHWSLLTAATIPAGLESVRDRLIRSTYHQAYNPNITFPLPQRYSSSSGVNVFGTTGSAIQGAAFGILAKGIKNVNISATVVSPTRNAKRIHTGAIVGGVVGGLAFLLIISGAIFFWRRHKHSNKRKEVHIDQWLDINPVLTPEAPLTSAVPLAEKHREIQGEPVIRPTAASGPTSSAYQNSDNLRAEVEDLRREVDLIRDISQLPPGYR